MGIQATFRLRKDAKEAGWFSRRHKTNAAHAKAHQRMLDRKAAKAARERECAAATAVRRAARAKARGESQ